jgi:hypothetical protein
MTSQIFKKKVPTDLFFGLLDEICLKNEKHYTFNLTAFKKGIFLEKIPAFLKNCESYYHVSKRKYLEKTNYNSFATVLRQICNFNKITYTSQIKYDKSSYEIIYYIYLNS